jgi:hypothetical protein
MSHDQLISIISFIVLDYFQSQLLSYLPSDDSASLLFS